MPALLSRIHRSATSTSRLGSSGWLGWLGWLGRRLGRTYEVERAWEVVGVIGEPSRMVDLSAARLDLDSNIREDRRS